MKPSHRKSSIVLISDGTSHRLHVQQLITVGAAVLVATLGGVGSLSGPAQAEASWMPTTPANWPTVVSRTIGADRPITAGASVHSETFDTVSGRQPAQVMDVDSNNRNIRLGIVGAGSTLINPADETPSSMATRTGAVAGINGGFFDINASGQPNDGQIVDGEIWKSPLRNHNGTFVVLKDGTSAIRDEEFAGTINNGTDSHPLYSINWTGDATGDQITEVTPRLGGPTDVSKLHPVFVEGSSKDGGQNITVKSIGPITSLPALGKNTAGLLASAAGAQWLTATVHVGDKLKISHSIAPNNDIQQLLQGPGQELVKDGRITSNFAAGNPSGMNPETAIGVSADGRHLTMVALDGRGTESTAVGPTVAQVAGYLQGLGVDSALLLDGGGSTAMVARAPGTSTIGIVNSPSDSGNVERPVGNGIFVYSTEAKPGPAARASINDGKALLAVVGITTPAAAFATDINGNAAKGAGPKVTVQPSALGSWTDGIFTPIAPGSGSLTVVLGSARASVPLSVASKLSALASDPAAPDLGNGAVVTLALTGTVAGGGTVPIPSTAANWSVSDPALGTVDTMTGKFTAAANGTGIDTLTATVAGAKAIITVGVGSKSTELDPLNDSGAWNFNITNGAVATPSTDPSAPPGSAHTSSVRLDYSMPGTAGVHQMALSPSKPIVIDKNEAGQAPTALGVWIKDDDQVHNAFEFATSYKQSNGQSATLYNTALAYNGWTLLKTALPAGTSFPLTLNFLDMLSINPTQASTGTLRLSSLQALYAARAPEQPSYTPIPTNPTWLHYVESPSDFTGDGQTILMGDDAHLLANDPNGTSSHVIDDIAARVKGTGYTGADGQKAAALPASDRPQLAQMLGDMADNGQVPNLKYAAQKISEIGLPFHDLVGNHEITQGADPENSNFDLTFGKTHYSYTVGASTVIALDNSHGGITSSDPFQTPNETQYPWLVNQLDAANTPVVVLAIHMPADDPFPAKNSQMTDRWEAQQYLQIVQNYRTSHPGVHVLMVYGHARGFSDQVLDVHGNHVSGDAGIPQLTFADLGMPAYSTPAEGGFYHFGLIHITNNGVVQFAVEPVLHSLTIDGPAAATVAAGAEVTPEDALRAVTMTRQRLAIGDSETLTATGITETGDNLDPVNVPIADPVSHVWSSSAPSIVRIDATTGELSAVSIGTATITVTSGGMTAKQKVIVTAAQ